MPCGTGGGPIALQMQVSDGFLFCVEFSEASGVYSFLLEKCIFVQKLPYSYDNQVLTSGELGDY